MPPPPRASYRGLWRIGRGHLSQFQVWLCGMDILEVRVSAIMREFLGSQQRICPHPHSCPCWNPAKAASSSLCRILLGETVRLHLICGPESYLPLRRYPCLPGRLRLNREESSVIETCMGLPLPSLDVWLGLLAIIAGLVGC